MAKYLIPSKLIARNNFIVKITTAFKLGFLSGLAAPASLFASHQAPEARSIEVERLYRPSGSAEEAIRKDVEKIGAAIKSAIDRHGRT